MTGGEMVRLLQANGWELTRVVGSHHLMTKAGQRSIPVPVHGSRDLPKGTAAAILKQARIRL